MNNHEAQPDIPADGEQESGVPYNVAKHEKWHTPPEVISRAVAESGEALAGEPERIIKGETNEVYSVKTESGRELMVRIFHGDKNRFERENWALTECAKIGVPVPAMLSIQSVQSEGKTVHICVETKVDGADWEHGKPEDTARILERLGGELSKIHSIETHGFGVLDKNGNGRYRSVRDLIEREFFVGKDRILPFLKKDSPEAEAVVSAIDILKKEAVIYPDISPRLIHNDLSPDHVLVADGEISGIIDFESAFGGDPAMEFALWDFKHGKKYPTELIKRGYTDASVFSGDFERRFNFWKLYRALTSLRYCLQEGKQKGVDRALMAIGKAIEYFNA